MNVFQIIAFEIAGKISCVTSVALKWLHDTDLETNCGISHP